MRASVPTTGRPRLISTPNRGPFRPSQVPSRRARALKSRSPARAAGPSSHAVGTVDGAPTSRTPSRSADNARPDRAHAHAGMLRTATATSAGRPRQAHRARSTGRARRAVRGPSTLIGTRPCSSRAAPASAETNAPTPSAGDPQPIDPSSSAHLRNGTATPERRSSVTRARDTRAPPTFRRPTASTRHRGSRSERRADSGRVTSRTTPTDSAAANLPRPARRPRATTTPCPRAGPHGNDQRRDLRPRSSGPRRDKDAR